MTMTVTVTVTMTASVAIGHTTGEAALGGDDGPRATAMIAKTSTLCLTSARGGSGLTAIHSGVCAGVAVWTTRAATTTPTIAIVCWSHDAVE
jgi:hypothetical protein